MTNFKDKVWIVKKEIAESVGVLEDEARILKDKNKKIFDEKEEERKKELQKNNVYVEIINTKVRFYKIRIMLIKRRRKVISQESRNALIK